MSWNKRTPAADQQPYGAPQPVPMQPNMYANYQGAPGTGPQQQYWQMPPAASPAQPPAQAPGAQPQYNQQYSQPYQQQGYGNANQFFAPPNQQYNQNFSNQGYNNAQPGLQQNFYQNPQQTQQPNYSQNNKAGADGWEDNWDWGWDDASRKGQKPSNPNMPPAQPVQPQHQPQQAFNNANVIEDSFAATDTWNWSMEDKREPSVQPPTHPVQESKEPVQSNADNIQNSTHDITSQRSASNHSAQHAEEVRTLNDKEVIKERLPNLALGKRFHLENLTPQWSIESQMSQESSDGPNTHSEGTYRSENQSRNSSKGSPGPIIDNSNFNYTQAGFDEMYPQNSEWSVNSTDEPTVNSIQNSSRRQESQDDLLNSLQDMSITSHERPVSQNKLNVEQDLRNKQESKQLGNIHPPPSMSPANMVPAPAGLSTNMPPPPPVTASGLPPPIVPPTMPQSNFPASSSQNPFKQSGPFSHKTNANIIATSPFPPSMNNANLTAPSKVAQSRGPVGFGANLETTPDNSERPDQPQVPPFRPTSVSQQIPDNLEVAPQNDRNEYLQTAHLSSGDYEENTNFSGNAPPPGLRRMVVGQQESEYQNLNISADEPPPGLSRMVPGQQTEADNSYNQPNDNYLDRHVDGQPTDSGSRPYRQADGQQTPENYNQPPANRSSDRRPIGLDRMVPGESSNNEYAQYQNSNYVGSNTERVVTGVDHDYPMTRDVGPSDVREQNMDGSDFSDQTARNPPRSSMSSREVPELPDFLAPDVEQREVIMEGENLQDLSNISSNELTFSREQIVDGADLTLDGEPDRKTDVSDSLEQAASSPRRHSFSRVNTSGDDSDRDRAFKSSPRRDREKRKTSRDHDRDKEGRYSRGDRKYEREPERRSVREDRRPEKERREKKRERRDREESPDAYKHRRSTRSHRYETEDTDYYSDRERERRRYREGSYTSKPPRPDDREKRHDRERNRRYNTIERDRGYEDDRRDRHKGRHEARYRNIDPTRKYGNLHLEREEHRRAGDSPVRAGTDDELNESRRRERDPQRRTRHNRHDPYYDEYNTTVDPYGRDPYLTQRYQYYEQLRLTDPAAYMQLYKRLMRGAPPYYAPGYGITGYESRTEERGSVHSGRSSANGLKTDTLYGFPAARTPSLRTYLSDRDLTTDASLNLQLEESTVRSERMTPFKYATAHVKASISSRHLVLVRACYPADGPPAAVRVLALRDVLRGSPDARELAACPTPLRNGITHKKSVLEYVWGRAREPPPSPTDKAGYALLWEFLAALLTQNGVVVGTDLAELLMKNQKDFPYSAPAAKKDRGSSRNVSRRESSTSREDDRTSSPEQANHSVSDVTPASESAIDEQAALDKLREYLTYGNRHEALEWAMTSKLWGHALHLASFSDRRTRGTVTSRFLASLPRADPLLTLYCALAAAPPPAAACVSDARWGDWRGHAAMLLANTSAKPDSDKRTLIQMGDSLMSRGLTYSAQFCYITAGEPFGRHPLSPLAPAPAAAPPRLALLMADPRAASLPQLATNTAILATEIYEYAMSLHQPDYTVPELQVYKLVLGARLADVGELARALALAEACQAAVARAPQHYSAEFTRSLNVFHHRLMSHDTLLESLVDGDSAQPSPVHTWDMHSQMLQGASAHGTPQHVTSPPAPAQAQAWEQNEQYQQPPIIPTIPTIPTYEPEDNPDYPHYQPPAEHAEQTDEQAGQLQWGEEGYSDYWQQPGYGYGEYGATDAAPQITLPGSAPLAPRAAYRDYDDDRPPSADQPNNEPDTAPKPAKAKEEARDARKAGGGGWLGGILTKLSLRPPNQMILPDDKNPSIVWDAEKKRWRNLEGDDDVTNQPPPPPPSLPQSAPSPAGPPAPVSNIFKMQKGRHIKKAYVDVLNPGGANRPPAAPAPGPPPPPGGQPHFFTPTMTDHSQMLTLSMPPSPCYTPHPSPPPSPRESGIFEPAQIPTDDHYNTGI